MFKNYLKLAIKVLLRRKMFTFINLFGISFTLSILLATTAIYTLTVVSNPVQKNLSRLLFVSEVAFQDSNSTFSGALMPYFIEQAIRPLKKNIAYFALTSSYNNDITLYINNQRTDIQTRETDENYWRIFTFQFLEGAPYNLQDIQNGRKIIVICQSLKERIFGQQTAIGKSLTFDNKTYTITGVVKDVPRIYISAYSQIWIPYNYANYWTQVRNKNYEGWAYQAILLVNHPGNFNTVRDQFKKIVEQIHPIYNENGNNMKIWEKRKSTKSKMESSLQYTFKIFNNGSIVTSDNKNWLLIVFSIFISIIPIINLTNLSVSRIFERSSEIGVRKSFGATKNNMIYQFVYENIILTLVGGMLGFLGAWCLLKIIDSSNLIVIGHITFSIRVYITGFLLILFFGILSGFYPAYKMSKLQIVQCLKGGNQ